MAAAIEATPVKGWRPNKARWTAVLLLIGGGAAYQGLTDWRDNHAFLINRTDSLPVWAFWIHKNQAPERGEYVFFKPPANALVARHFGTKPEMFGKIVYGMPGDEVRHQGRDVLVNGHVVAQMKPITKAGEPLTAGPTGKIPQGCFYVGTPHKDGFDSRYAEIGYACTNKIIGTGVPVL
ncbi:S26 family signal peptidase [Sphingomonas xinjiangensis]|uniref:Conjugal transfer pilin signal peptidase TrbI n=1 Tax=Sphingomonas xinjiangensis TaxID=643568 RepID=A0A840YPM6_9SPHN|nr:S26 family signal peptidase [Sphingomonas xinjiangensis]MBB5712350.1 conjugal transfer pilin signal peptidase TrbI [Sphingomonas xinjiangensis]